MSDMKKILAEKERWAAAELRKKPCADRYTEWGDPVAPLYTPDDVQEIDYLQEIGFPGEHPFTRGVHAAMYRGQTWTMRQYSGFATPEDTNERFKYLLAQGQTGLSVAFDLPTQIGLDSDDTLSEGEVGKVGVPVDTLADMEIIFKDLPLEKLSTSMTINAPAAILLAMYVAIGEKRGIPSAKLRGTIQNDILKEYTVRGTYIFPPEPSIRLITDTFAFCSKEIPQWNSINVAGYHMREAGCTAVQEIAFSFANAIAYIEAALAAGLNIDSFAPRISWIFNTNNKIFEEVAKYRAARRVWAKLLKERFEAKDPRSWMLRFHTQTSGVSLTAQQPENNIIRTAYQALAAVLGGCQSLAVCSFDEALALPTEKSVRISLRTQQILAHESGVTDTVDPLGGSYYIEALTEDMTHQIEALIARIDEMGGAIKAVKNGFIQSEIENRAYQIQKEIEAKQRIVVGVNEYQLADDGGEVPIFSFDEGAVETQLRKLAAVKQGRNQAEVNAALAKIHQVAKDGGSLMPHFITAVKVYATLGEICRVLKDVFGEYQPVGSR